MALWFNKKYGGKWFDESYLLEKKNSLIARCRHYNCDQPMFISDKPSPTEWSVDTVASLREYKTCVHAQLFRKYTAE